MTQAAQLVRVTQVAQLVGAAEAIRQLVAIFQPALEQPAQFVKAAKEEARDHQPLFKVGQRLARK